MLRWIKKLFGKREEGNDGTKGWSVASRGGYARGGDGGKGKNGRGGNGGNAIAIGRGSKAVGGKGGDAL